MDHWGFIFFRMKRILPVHSLKSHTCILMKSSYLFFYEFYYTFTQADTSSNDLDEWKLYCKICLLPLVLISQVLVCHLCFWALSLFHATTLNPSVRTNIMPFFAVQWPSFCHLFLKLFFFFSLSSRLKGTYGWWSETLSSSGLFEYHGKLCYLTSSFIPKFPLFFVCLFEHTRFLE